jgi:hypothetical protein
MALSFTYSTQRIGVLEAEAQPLLLQDLINAIRDEEASERGIVEPQIADATGKASLGGAVATGITVALRDAWVVEFAAGAYQATVTGGNLADALDRVHNTGSPQVLMLASAAATLIETGVSGLTSEESAQLASVAGVPAAVAQRVVEGGLTLEQVLRVLLAATVGKTAGAGSDTETFYGRDGTTPRVVTTFAGGDRASVTVNGA